VERFRGGSWSAFSLVGGALRRLVERSGGSCSALLGAQVRGALWELEDGSGGYWSAPQAMVMEARSFISHARLRPPPCRVEKVVPNRHFVIYSYVLNDLQIFRLLAGGNTYSHMASDVKNSLYCRSAEWKCVYFHWFGACGMRSLLVVQGSDVKFYKFVYYIFRKFVKCCHFVCFIVHCGKRCGYFVDFAVCRKLRCMYFIGSGRVGHRKPLVLSSRGLEMCVFPLVSRMPCSYFVGFSKVGRQQPLILSSKCVAMCVFPLVLRWSEISGSMEQMVWSGLHLSFPYKTPARFKIEND
jgi:hypothetical protein